MAEPKNIINRRPQATKNSILASVKARPLERKDYQRGIVLGSSQNPSLN